VEKVVIISSQCIELDALLKWAGAAQTGGEAKHLIKSGAVSVNGRPESRRARKIVPGDRVAVGGMLLVVSGEK
jgi:ribosome-associated protein